MNVNNNVHTGRKNWNKVSPYRRRKFTETLNSFLGDTDLLQKKLAIELEVSEPLISYYLNGSRTILPDHLCAMYIALWLDPHIQRKLFAILNWSIPDDSGKRNG